MADLFGLRLRFIVLLVFSMAASIAVTAPKETGNAFLITENPETKTEKQLYITETDESVPALEVVEADETENEGFILYDVPLDAELQKYTYDICTENNVDYKMVLAMMGQESSYQEDAISKTKDYGILQINQINHKWLEDKLGIENFLDAKQNILAGVYMLADLTDKYADINKVLMAYNCGESGAQKLWEKGIYSTEYSRKIHQLMNEMMEVEGANEKMD
jgi:hypothetical protein